LFAVFIVGLIRFGPHVSSRHRTFLIVWLGSIYLIHIFGRFKAVHNDIGILFRLPFWPLVPGRSAGPVTVDPE
jgi:hypothetical protein